MLGSVVVCVRILIVVYGGVKFFNCAITELLAEYAYSLPVLQEWIPLIRRGVLTKRRFIHECSNHQNPVSMLLALQIFNRDRHHMDVNCEHKAAKMVISFLTNFLDHKHAKEFCAVIIDIMFYSLAAHYPRIFKSWKRGNDNPLFEELVKISQKTLLDLNPENLLQLLRTGRQEQKDAENTLTRLFIPCKSLCK